MLKFNIFSLLGILSKNYTKKEIVTNVDSKFHRLSYFITFVVVKIHLKQIQLLFQNLYSILNTKNTTFLLEQKT